VTHKPQLRPTSVPVMPVRGRVDGSQPGWSTTQVVLVDNSSCPRNWCRVAQGRALEHAGPSQERREVIPSRPE